MTLDEYKSISKIKHQIEYLIEKESNKPKITLEEVRKRVPFVLDNHLPPLAILKRKINRYNNLESREIALLRKELEKFDSITPETFDRAREIRRKIFNLEESLFFQEKTTADDIMKSSHPIFSFIWSKQEIEDALNTWRSETQKEIDELEKQFEAL